MAKLSTRPLQYVMVLISTVVLAMAVWTHTHTAARLKVTAPETAVVFDKWEATVTVTRALSGFRSFPGTQVNDAYDADRNGQFIRMTGTFTHSTGHSITVPSFAMKHTAKSDWQHTIRWSPDRPGQWALKINFEGSDGSREFSFCHNVNAPITAIRTKGLNGYLRPPKQGDNPNYLREQQADGSDKPIMLYGTCRSWAIRHENPSSPWGKDELIDRENDLFAPMRQNNLNLLNQWMAPWEYLLVHHARSEHWEQPDHTFESVTIPQDQAWSSHQYYDQGRAAAFDTLINHCEGNTDTPVIRLFLSPLPHPLFRQIAHPWSNGHSFWSPWENPTLSPSGMNGFCISEDMEAWDFFKADPRHPLADDRCKLFDHQANFFRYLIARWGYSRALGAWVLLDEIEGIGDEESYLPERTGFWQHPQCQRWLNDMIRLFNGRLQRVADGLPYSGDPFDHPTSAAASSTQGSYARGANLDWKAGDYDARPDIQGWHWYPPIAPPILDWHDAWNTTLSGVLSFSEAPLGDRPRLISEFGAEDRQDPQFTPSSLYPSIYHLSIWASALSGQAGTVMDWNDGKTFGEFYWKASGAFSAERYPVSQTESLRPLQLFLKDVDLEDLRPANSAGSAVQCSLAANGTATALTNAACTAVLGWLFSPDTRVDNTFTLRGIAPGTYTLAFYDTWTGLPVSQQTLKIISSDTTLEMNIQPVLHRLKQGGRFPHVTRKYQGHDIAFKLFKNERNVPGTL